MKRILIFTLIGTLGLQAAIKKADGEKAAPRAEAPRSAEQSPSELKGQELKDLVEQLRKMREKKPDGARSLDLSEMAEIFRFQTDPKLAEKLDRNFRELLDGSRPGTLKAAPSTVIFRDAKKPGTALSFGAIVEANGWVLTKNSEVTEARNLECQVKGAWVPAKVVRVWDDHDLALVKITTRDLPAVQWATGNTPGVGTFISAVAPQGQEPIALGVISVAPRNLQNKGRGFLGVRLDSDEKGVKVRELVPGGAAITAGVQENDRILEVDGKKPESVFSFTRIISDRKAGEKVQLRLQRGNDILIKEVQLGDRGAQPNLGRGFDSMNNLGSTISKRRDNFPSVLQTDLPLDASQCGGPVTDLDGNVIGLVIARSGRIESLVLPSEVIRQTLATVDFAKEASAATK